MLGDGASAVRRSRQQRDGGSGGRGHLRNLFLACNAVLILFAWSHHGCGALAGTIRGADPATPAKSVEAATPQQVIHSEAKKKTAALDAHINDLVNKIVSGDVPMEKLDDLINSAAKKKASIDAGGDAAESKKAREMKEADDADDAGNAADDGHADRHLAKAHVVRASAEAEGKPHPKKGEAPHPDDALHHKPEAHPEAHKEKPLDVVIPKHKMSYASGPPPSAFWDGGKDKGGSGEFVTPADTDIDTRPLIEFVMIVKNEAGSIQETIESVEPWVDRYTILDTGSTDGTQDLIKK